jgi:hypothetical protein
MVTAVPLGPVPMSPVTTVKGRFTLKTGQQFFIKSPLPAAR